MNHLITFGGNQYDRTTEITVRDAPKFGVDKVVVYDDRWLMEQEFHQLNHWLWNTISMRGFGWFCWKPYIIMHALSCVQEGDVVLYLDADTYPIGDLRPLYERCVADNGAMFFAAQGCSNRQWVKADCVLTMAAGREVVGRRSVVADTQHGVARFMLFQAGPWHVQQFLAEWLTYCLNPSATTFEPSTLCPEIEGFEQHRTEQAIMSLLAHKYGYHLYREACQFGDAALAAGVDTWYPTLFHQVGTSEKGTLEGSRFRNVE